MRITILLSSFILLVNSQGIDEEVCRTSTDIIVVADGSYSIRESGYNRLKEWVLELPKLFEMGPENVNIGLVAFSTRPYIIQPLTSDKYIFNNTIINDLDWLCRESNSDRCLNDIPCYHTRGRRQFNCQTGTGVGMELAYQMLRNSTRFNKEYTNQVMIIITDGYWNLGIPPYEVISKPEYSSMNVTRIVITVGSTINNYNALSYASVGPVNDTERYLINSNNFEELNNTLPYMTRTICEAGIVTPPIIIDPPPPSIIDPPPEEISNNGIPAPLLATAIGVPAVVALATLPFLLKGKKPINDNTPIIETPEITEEPIITSSEMMPPLLMTPDMDTDIGAIGSPPPPDNKPLYAPASRAQVPSSGKFSGGNNRSQPINFLSG